MKPDILTLHDVTNELKWEPDLTSRDISVKVHDGIVTLRGKVPSLRDKTTAENVAWRVIGVRAIANEIEIRQRHAYERSDEDIARGAVNALKWNYSLPNDLKVTVASGWVTLAGQTALDFLKTEAGEVVGSLMGVLGVTNNIKILDIVQPAEIKATIEGALRASNDNNKRHIQVAVTGGHVTLSGRVPSFSDVQTARRAAWNAPGVLVVENNLMVS
jgi:osmotically-inducible protein OsmY